MGSVADKSLQGCRILIVEDEYLLADDLSDTLAAMGAHVIGPYATVQEALLNARQAQFDAAVLDINLRGEMVFPVADVLVALQIPFLFATGYDQGSLPERFADAVRLEKPVRAEKVTAVLARLLAVAVNASRDS
jgi:two-component SAPR family response regulator